MARRGRTGSSAKRRMPGTMPEVDTVMRDSGMPICSTSRRTAAMKASKLRNGSPIPINTRLMRSRPGSACCRLRTAATWPAISPAVRLRMMPSFAVRQNWQLTAQPIWLETQMVARDHPRSGSSAVAEGAVTLFAAVAFGHPHGLDGLAVVAGDQVALRAVDGLEGLGNLRAGRRGIRRPRPVRAALWATESGRPDG